MCTFYDKLKKKSLKLQFPFISEYTSSEKQLIVKALQGFSSKTCIRFVPLNNETDCISVENKSGCFSFLGKVGGSQVISLQRSGCVSYGIIQHEFNHALGFWNKHTRSDCDNYVRINWANMDPQMAFNFNKQVTNNLNTSYDYSSIMHYGRTAFSINEQDTITPIPNPNVQIGQSQGLSSMDIIKINKLYSC
ncbi:high choriolytic enzyme 1-like [Perca flavescens]|uniref:high choriolytic enzyme 1-like n=1 Tax=Perca flavescens TaxID=8167 RepID=UPI00106DF7F9|nr:high choriolytic enzyme 1-like [Perca flavescens]